MASERSPHILNTSSSLLGFCLVVITSLKVTNTIEATLLDEATAIASLLLMICCVLSYMSIRALDEVRSARLARVADGLFLVALLLVFITIVLITLNFII